MLIFCKLHADGHSKANKQNRDAASTFQSKLITALFVVKAVREDLKERYINLTQAQCVKMLVEI